MLWCGNGYTFRNEHVKERENPFHLHVFCSMPIFLTNYIRAFKRIPNCKRGSKRYHNMNPHTYTHTHKWIVKKWEHNHSSLLEFHLRYLFRRVISIKRHVECHVGVLFECHYFVTAFIYAWTDPLFGSWCLAFPCCIFARPCHLPYYLNICIL